jgi:two-component system OmpR family response regulator
MMSAVLSETPAHVLVVDDDEDLREQIAGYLTEHGFEVSTAKDAKAMDAILREAEIDLVVLDLMLPGEDGLSVCQRLREAERPSILMLSAMGEPVDRIVGLELGADDYLAKPCMPRELLARVRAILRQTRNRPDHAPNDRSPVYRFSGLRLDVVRRELQAANGVTVLLTTGEFTLLKAFVERPNQILSRDQLLEAARGHDTDAFDRAIDVQISRLRRKLADFTERELIRTYRGAGYLFNEVVTRQ